MPSITRRVFHPHYKLKGNQRNINVAEKEMTEIHKTYIRWTEKSNKITIPRPGKKILHEYRHKRHWNGRGVHKIAQCHFSLLWKTDIHKSKQPAIECGLRMFTHH